jgi:hypothetical protein
MIRSLLARLHRLIRNAPPDRREQWGHLGTMDSPEDDY